VNLGPGDPLLAHTADERVTRNQLERTWSILRDLVVCGVET
jgi:acetylornithine deacetylase/succinyl-diaminopimelate desuccinylase-like protein